MFCQVTIYSKAAKARDIHASNLSRESLEQRVLVPYRQGRPITLSGTTIDCSDLARVQIVETEEIIDERDVMGRLTLQANGFIYSRSERDITDELITGPPGGELEVTSQHMAEIRPEAGAGEVFVVHGRNLTARNELFSFLRAIDLHLLEWSEAVQATGKTSPYIGEILDAAFSRAHAVVVLFTPDDEARLKEEFWADSEPSHETELTGQARPNVLFEAGMAMGRFENRTILVELGVLRPFSDVAGRHVLRLDNSTPRRQELAQRLETAGCPVNLDGTAWHSAGDFEAALLLNDTRDERHAIDVSASEEQRFFEMLNASKQIRKRIAQLLSPVHPNTTTVETENIVIALAALAGQVSALGMNELNGRLEMRVGIKEKLNKISTMLAYFEGHIMNRNFEGAKQEFASYDPLRDDKGLP